MPATSLENVAVPSQSHILTVPQGTGTPDDGQPWKKFKDSDMVKFEFKSITHGWRQGN